MTNDLNSNPEESDCDDLQSADSMLILEKLKTRRVKLSAFQEQTEKDLQETRNDIQKLNQFLGVGDQVTNALEVLSEQLFQSLLKVIESHLTNAVQDVLEQPIELKSVVEWKRNAIAVDFHMRRDGNEEDILKGQGGSVANILSIGLRMFALTTLNENEHRRVLILDEQDCWLKPDLVSKLVKIIKSAASELGFQMIMISHHDISAFVDIADKIYRLEQNGDTVQVSNSAVAE